MQRFHLESTFDLFRYDTVETACLLSLLLPQTGSRFIPESRQVLDAQSPTSGYMGQSITV
ncbi:hypothetical protein J6590_037683 [Homalodisca vitripennis]|nr:hypothetical protein J6590_037683 [Homalodisca vitripennis]